MAVLTRLRWTILVCADLDTDALNRTTQIKPSGVARGAYQSASSSPANRRDVA